MLRLVVAVPMGAGCGGVLVRGGGGGVSGTKSNLSLSLLSLLSSSMTYTSVAFGPVVLASTGGCVVGMMVLWLGLMWRICCYRVLISR